MIKVQFLKTAADFSVKVLTQKEGENLPSAGLSSTEKKLITTAANQARFVGKKGQVLTVLGSAAKIVVIGVGKNPDSLAYRCAGGESVKAILGDASVVCDMTAVPEYAADLAYGVLLGSYRFDKYKTKKSADSSVLLERMTVLTTDPKKTQKEFQKYQSVAEGVYLARDFCSEPANVLTPKTFAAEIKKLEKLGVSVEILDLKALKEKKFGMLLSVAQGSVNEPRVVVMTWKGAPKRKTTDLGFVGKGVTFDSGGISLKPGAGMWDMKQDMTGAAVVTATLYAAAKRKVNANLMGIVGLVENMPSGTATRPGDVVTSLSGQTVEILNTDAEGRLVLGDCLWYLQQQYGVKKIVDLATLTGATMRALGDEYAGLFANDDHFADQLIEAGQSSGEKLWRMPMGEAYNKKLDSTIADMKNIGGANAGGSTAACFLGRFIQEGTVWAHLDIAGVDHEEKGRPLCPKGSTGWGVQLLNAFIK